MSRSTPEWIGRTDDTPCPPRVKLRVFEAYGGRCHWTGKKIMPGEAWDADHVIALINGGQNRESNLAPILHGKAHKEKTDADVAEKSKVARMKAKHLGVWPRSLSRLKSAPFPKITPRPARGIPDMTEAIDETLDETALLPCPFCGCANIEVEDRSLDCSQCHAGFYVDKGQNVRAAWNRRSPLAASVPVTVKGLVEHMVCRFLGWSLPETFSPDGGISFERSRFGDTVYPMPSGTNLLDYTQAMAMVEHMLEGAALSPQPAGAAEVQS